MWKWIRLEAKSITSLGDDRNEQDATVNALPEDPDSFTL